MEYFMSNTTAWTARAFSPIFVLANLFYLSQLCQKQNA